ncbi:MAG: bifunctional 5,10-methylenetetrahydrofolate dehydrogenase/5,10-methenyltetrahydrofolate cyclohydrolase [Chlamydiae bacterium]|nr:bifunctional 5,10-methylenetetrahydrofolate dehydrogenase/5,10-methenyltetrahydrofolate cyclohydrolase [Chlamydiota bacterium]MBI3276604.1 bifunctional 5,10-methylenetetrahydrofolate dehydrogenase/5,10-methenyltetrahydrofolate cyclohydrolase [Chlamydiota bacterium]
MSAQLLDGKKVSSEIKEEIRNETQSFTKKTGIKPGLAFVLVGEDPPSQAYVKSKSKACEEVGFFSETLIFSNQVSEKELLNAIEILNHRSDIHGMIVQHPLPSHIRESLVYESILPQKDVDGFHPFNVGRLLLGNPQFIPCTPLGIVEILKRSNIAIQGKHVVLVGRSNIVGKPAAALFFQKDFGTNATVTICHSATKNIIDHIHNAEILIAAIGKPEWIKGSWISEGVVVVDVGINRVIDPQSPKGYRLVGDVDFKEVSQKAKAITPVPGGIGLMTVAMLLKNTLEAAKNSHLSLVAGHRLPVSGL